MRSLGRRSVRPRRKGVAPRAAFEWLESRLPLAGDGPRPFIDLGPSDNVALDQPRVTVEFGDSDGRSVGPDIFNSWLLDTGANTILVFKTAVDDMNESSPPYRVEGVFEELGVGGSQLFDLSAPYRFDFAGVSGERRSLADTRVISDATRDVSMFGPFGIVGMPAMTERVTTLDFTPWLTFGEGNFLMATDFPGEIPAPAGPRYTVSVDDRVSFSPDGHVIEGDHPPAWADIPFFTAEVRHGDAVVSGDFMFDTGAQVTIISTAMALSLGLDSNADGLLDSQDVGYTRSETVGGVGGSREAPVFMVDSVHVPTDQGTDLAWSNLLWLIADIAPGIDGVFGFDIVTSGWIDAVFTSGGAGSILQAHLDFRGWESAGAGKIHFDLNPDLAAVQVPGGPGGIVVERGGSTIVSERGVEDEYTLRLSTRPAADVVVEIVAPAHELRAFPTGAPGATSLVFTPSDWDVPRSVTVRAVDDSTEQSLHRSFVRHVPSSSDPAYDGVGMPRVIVNIVDDDYPAVMILPTDGQTDVAEGGEGDSYALVLEKAPSRDVTIVLEPQARQVSAVSASDGTGSLTFTPENWSRPQSVRVAAVDDTLVEGPHRAYVNHRIETADEAYAEAYALPEIVFVADDDETVFSPPTLATAFTGVTGRTGESLTASGTWGHADATQAVTLAASMGTVTAAADGTWSWSFVPPTPIADERVTVTATDGRGLVAVASFTILARDVATAVTGVPGDATVSLSWTAPTTAPGLPVTGYRVEASTDDGVTWTALPDAAAATTIVVGLANGTPHRFRVAARDAAGDGPWSAASSVIVPVAPPTAPGTPLATAGDRRVGLTWSAPASDGGTALVEYAIESSEDGGTAWHTVARVPATSTSTTLAGLVNGRSYVFRVAAVNAVGAGAPTPASVPAIPALPAGVPAALKVVAGDGRATLSWKAPASNGGSPITDYVIEVSGDGGKTWRAVARPATSATAATVVGLANGVRHVFRVAAVNSVGAAAFTGSSAPVVPAGRPGTVGRVDVVRGNASVRLSWQPPSATGGLPLAAYVVESSTDGGRTWRFAMRTRATAVIVPGLANGVAREFRVTAVNALGAGAAGPASAVVVPATVPAVPTALVVTRGDGVATIRWRAPARDGGAAIAGYVLQTSLDGGRTWETVVRDPSAATTATVTGLANGVARVFRVAAANEVGTGAFTARSAAVVPAALPGIPVDPRVVASSSGRWTLAWSPPAVNGGVPVTDYRVWWSTDGQTWRPVARKRSPAPSAVVAGAAASGSVFFRVAAVNAVGTGAAAEVGSVVS